jgi:hypothetical protein
MRMLVKKACLMAVLLISLQGISQQVIQATLKLNTSPDEVEVWLRPNFNNTSQYMAQLGIPIAWPSAPPTVQPALANITITLAASFEAAFGANYSKTPYPIAHNTANTENYFVISLIRGGNGASNPQIWNAGVEFKLLTVKFPPGTPNAKVKIADYLDGGSDGQGYYYTADGNATYYTPPNSVDNFYSTFSHSTTGSNGGGFIETNVAIPVACVLPAVSITNVTNASAEITWSSVSGSTGYEYAVTGSSIPPVSGTSTTTTLFSPSGLTAGTQYYFHVRTNCGGGSFSAWSTSGFTTSTVACDPPSMLTVNAVGITTADISWNTVNGATGYEYFLSTSSTIPGSAPGTGAPISGTIYNANGLTGETTYHIYIRTNCGGGNYSPWVGTSFTTQPPLCSSPSTPVPGVITTTTAEISWAAVGSSLGYEYVVSTSSTQPNGPGTATVSPNITETNLTPGTAYYVFIRNNCGGGLFSDWVSAQFNTLCPEPGSVAVGSIGSSSATITWNLTGATSYQVDISTSSTPTTVTPSTGGIIVPGNSYNATDLVSGIAYYAHVRSVCPAGNFSNWVSVPFNTECTTPGPISVTGIAPTTANIIWGAVSDADGYEYIISTTGTTPTTTGTPIIFNNIAPFSLTQGTKYYIFVRTKCSPGVYSDWISASFTTTFPPCKEPLSLSVSLNGGTANIVWSSVNGAIGYERIITTSKEPPVSGTPGNDTTYQESGLIASTQYYIYVRAVCGLDRFSGWVSSPFKTICFKPSLFISRYTTIVGTAELGWKKLPGVIKYEYAVSEYGVPPSGSLNTTVDTFLHITNLLPGKKYYLHVRAHCNASSISEWTTLVFYTSGISAVFDPSSRTLRIAIIRSENENEEVALFDVTGRLVKAIKLTNNLGSINLVGYASGVYFIRYGKGKKYVTKFVLK